MDFREDDKKNKLTREHKSMIRKAIIPIAGLGTRLYPATRGVRKEFMPVIDRDGMMKPVLLILLGELYDSGIEKICLVINQDDRVMYENYFKKPLPDKHYNLLSDDAKQYENTFKRIAKKVTFVCQDQQKGFGHAVYLAKDFAEDDPVLLLLGDTIYRSNSEKTCVQQLMNAYDSYGGAIVAIHKVPLNRVSEFGIFAGSWKDDNERVMLVDHLKEKPSSEYAEEYLWVTGKNEYEKGYFGAFGIYVLNKSVFGALEKKIRISERQASSGEIDLMGALDILVKDRDLLAFVPEGTSYDIGNSKAYAETFQKWCLEN